MPKVDNDNTLKALLSLRKSKTRLLILDALLSSDTPLGIEEIAKKINLNENATSVALHYLVKTNLVLRVKRGLYEANLKLLCRAILILLSSTKFLEFLTEYKKLKKQ